jgi:tyrosinase-like protein/polyphenol oxidase-like protein
MKNSHFSRRDFIQGAGIASGLLLLKPLAFAQIKIPQLNQCAKYTRKNIKNFTAAELTALKNGVQVMKSRPQNDPTSWLYQANIHGTFTTPVQPAWNSCKHWTLFFLSWHRMYLHFFERILRAASGSASFALPYWGYFHPSSRQIPLAYRNPANASNPLYENNRNTTMNDGGSLPASAASHTLAFAYVPFGSFSVSLEGTPHGDVHTTIGGGMGSFEFAGRDPVFWLHHCNIDLLWNSWLSQCGGRTNPVGNTSWMNTMFTFFDETGTQVQMSGSQVVKSAAQLNYCYDVEILPALHPDCMRRLDTQGLVIAGKIRLQDIPAVSEQLKVELTARTSRIVLNLNDAALSEITVALAVPANAAEAPRLVLNFEGVEGKPPEGYFEVYINLPESVKDPDYGSEHYAGNLSFFGLGSGHSDQGHEKPRFKQIITNPLRQLFARKLLTNNNLTLTFVGRGPISPEGRQLSLSPDTLLRIERVRLAIESQPGSTPN